MVLWITESCIALCMELPIGIQEYRFSGVLMGYLSSKSDDCGVVTFSERAASFAHSAYLPSLKAVILSRL